MMENKTRTRATLLIGDADKEKDTECENLVIAVINGEVVDSHSGGAVHESVVIIPRTRSESKLMP